MKLLVALTLIVAVYAKNEEYVGWKSYTVGPPTQEQLKTLGEIVHEADVDVLSHPIVARAGVVLVKPKTHDEFLRKLDDVGIPYAVHSDDVYAALQREEVLFEERRQASRARNGGRTVPYDNYYDYYVIDQYLQDIAASYPDKVTLVTPANSYEGRPIRYLKISTTNFEERSKPVIFIDGGIHSREWISPPSVTYAIRKLVEDVTESDLLDNFDWIILPVVNPDGYQYTFTHSRFWRKTRSTNTHTLSFICPGVDGNRNYDFFWDTTGTSPGNPCTDIYAGNRAFSEIETQVVRNIINENLDRMALYITMHSYGSMILYPWGHDGSLSGNAFALHTVGVSMAQAMDAASLSNFPNYIVGNSVLVIGYPAAGAAEDYAHLVGVPLSYTFELPGLAGGFEGFHLDPIYIEQVVDETWQGIVVGARRAGELW